MSKGFSRSSELTTRLSLAVRSFRVFISLWFQACHFVTALSAQQWLYRKPGQDRQEDAGEGSERQRRPAFSSALFTVKPLRQQAAPSPSQLLQHRSFMDTLSKIPSKGDKNVLACLEDRQHIQKSSYNQHAKAIEPLRPGQPVSVLESTSHAWKPATVRTVCDERRSYTVVTLAGNKVRRNRAHLKERQPERQPDEKPTPAAGATDESSSIAVASSSTDSSPGPVQPMPRHLNRQPTQGELSMLHKTDLTISYLLSRTV